MALVKQEVLDNMIETGNLKPEETTGLKYKDKAIIMQKQRGGDTTKKRRAVPAHYIPEEKKIEAATLFAAMGNFKRVAALAKIPEKIVRRWGQEDWWFRILADVKRDESFGMDKKMSTIVDKALDKLVDRIEGGDYVYDIRQGKAVPIPMSGRDLSIVTGTVFDKRQLLRGDATKIVAAVNSEEHLLKLANKFIEAARQVNEKVITGEVLDIEVSDGEIL